MNIKHTGKTEYHTNGQLNTSGEMTFRLTVEANGQEVTMKFNIREAGKWQVTDSTLTETTEDGEITPADDLIPIRHLNCIEMFRYYAAEIKSH